MLRVALSFGTAVMLCSSGLVIMIKGVVNVVHSVSCILGHYNSATKTTALIKLQIRGQNQITLLIKFP